ncbi:hypothetical protein VP01_5578g1, partial [Puccinia sorghi]
GGLRANGWQRSGEQGGGTAASRLRGGKECEEGTAAVRLRQVGWARRGEDGSKGLQDHNKYLAGTVNLKLTLQPDSSDSSNTIQHFTDATWAEDIETQLSRSGSICFWKSCPISWNSKRQRNITLSSTEAELNALSDGVQENLWIQYLIEELYNAKLNPTQFNVNNKGLLNKINNLGSNSKTKHLDIKAKWLCDLRKTIRYSSNSFHLNR